MTDTRLTSRWLPAGLLTVATLGQVPGYFYALWEHLAEADWSDHAQFHHILGFLWLCGLATATLTLAWGPARRGERWASRLLVALTLFQFGSHLLTMMVLPAGKPPVAWQNGVLGVLALIGVGAAVLNLRRATVAVITRSEEQFRAGPRGSRG